MCDRLMRHILDQCVSVWIVLVIKTLMTMPWISQSSRQDQTWASYSSPAEKYLPFQMCHIAFLALHKKVHCLGLGPGSSRDKKKKMLSEMAHWEELCLVTFWRCWHGDVRRWHIKRSREKKKRDLWSGLSTRNRWKNRALMNVDKIPQ